MSRVAKPPDPIILPTADVASGEVSGHRLLCDDRIPIRLSHGRPAHLMGYWDRPAQCPDGPTCVGRHRRHRTQRGTGS